MNVKVDEYGTVRVTVSRRNLKTLLLKLDEPRSSKMLVRHCDGHALLLVAEDDDVHYADREPGPVHPREEERL